MGAHKAVRLDEAMDRFALSMKARNRAPRTIKNHLNPIRRMITEFGNIQVSAISADHMDRLLAATAEEWNWSTRNLYMDNLRGKRGFFAFCRMQGWMPRDRDPLELWDRQKGERRERKWIPVEEFVDLMDACDQPRDRMVVALGLFTMARGGEISLLQWKHADLTSAKPTLTVWREKIRKRDILPISGELLEELLVWKRHYCVNLGVTEVDPEWYIVPAKWPLAMAFDPTVGKLQPTGKAARLKPETRLGKPYETIQRAMLKLGLETFGGGMHVCRRSGGRAMFDKLRNQGYDGAMLRVSRMLGHSSIKQTEHYLGIELEQEQLVELIAGQPMFGDAVLGRKSAKIIGVSFG